MTITEEEQARREAARAAFSLARAVEESHAAVNLPLINAEWLQKLRASKLAELLAEAAGLEVTHRKRKLMQAQALRESARWLQALQSESEGLQARYYKALATVIGIYENNIRESAERSISAVQKLAAEVDKEEESVAADGLLSKVEKDLAALKQAHNAAKRASENAFMAHRREIMDVWDERCGITRILGEEKIQALSAALAETQATTANATRDTRERHKQMLHQDKSDFELIESRGKRIEEVKREIAAWQDRLEVDAAEWQQQINEAKSAKSEVLDRYISAQWELGQSRKRHEAKLKAVSVASGGVQNELEGILHTAEKVLKGLQLKKKQQKHNADE